MEAVCPSSGVGNPVSDGDILQQIYSLKQAYSNFYFMGER
jgi:hypothetical protein